MKSKNYFFSATLLMGILLNFLITSLKVIAQDLPPYEINTPLPCNFQGLGDYCYSSPWNTQRQFQKVTIGNCTFWVAYHDRTCTSGQLGMIYETNVTGIIYSGSGCENISNAAVLQQFRIVRYTELFQEHPDWFPWNNGEFRNDSATMYTYSTAQCNQTNNYGQIALDENFQPVPCDSNTYCCKRSVWFYKKNGVLQIDTLNPQYLNFKEIGKNNSSSPDTCLVPCLFNCYKPMRTINLTPCLNDQPCIDSADSRWQVKQVVINLTFCPQCKITIDYKVRENHNCPMIGNETLNDMIIDNMELNCPFRLDSITSAIDSACLNSVPKDSIYNFALDYLIKYKFLVYPNIGVSKPFYRIFKSACWADFFTPAFEGWPSRKVFSECNPGSCCWMQIQVKTESDGSHSYTILQQNPSSYNCLAPYDCNFYCGPHN